MLETISRGVVVIFLVLVSCSVWVLTSGAEPPALTRLKGAEKERLVKLIEGAKKEREILGWSDTWRPDVQVTLISKFREEYGLSEGDLKIKIESLRTAVVVTKVTEELRAKLYKTDVVQAGAPVWLNDLVARGELMAYDCPEYKHFHPMAADPEKAPANPPYFIAGVFSTHGIIYNPRYVKGEILHWKDVLQPEHKGKIFSSRR